MRCLKQDEAYLENEKYWVRDASKKLEIITHHLSGKIMKPTFIRIAEIKFIYPG